MSFTLPRKWRFKGPGNVFSLNRTHHIIYNNACEAYIIKPRDAYFIAKVRSFLHIRTFFLLLHPFSSHGRSSPCWKNRVRKSEWNATNVLFAGSKESPKEQSHPTCQNSWEMKQKPQPHSCPPPTPTTTTNGDNH